MMVTMTNTFGSCDTCGFDGDEQTPELRDAHLGHIAFATGSIEGYRSYIRERDSYPHASGDVTVIGPGCFANQDETVISWRGVNYSSQPRTRWFSVKSASRWTRPWGHA